MQLDLHRLFHHSANRVLIYFVIGITDVYFLHRNNNTKIFFSTNSYNNNIEQTNYAIQMSKRIIYIIKRNNNLKVCK
jgi:hypothetical protein